MPVSNQVLRFLIARDIAKGKTRASILAKLDGAGFSSEHAEQFIAQAERKVRARNRRCAAISALLVVVLLGRMGWGAYAHIPERQLLLAIMAAVFAVTGLYFGCIARWQAPKQ